MRTCISLCAIVIASKKAYATVVYLHQEIDRVSEATLSFPQTRLDPVKEITIPRLELMAILIGVRCIQYVKEQLMLEITNTSLWSDSQVALTWTNSDKSLPVFDRNMVCEIKEHSDIVISYLRFIRKLRHKNVSSCVTSKDIHEVEIMWIASIQQKVYATELNDLRNGKRSNLEIQLGIYVDSDELMRCRGRLDNSDLAEGARRPILLPKGERFKCLVVEKVHKDNMHSVASQTLAGVRSKYWIPQGR